MGEFDLIDRYFRRGDPAEGVKLGIGDDGAVLAPAAGHDLVAAIDTLVEGVHFRSGTAPHAVGHKALAVNLSDLAAMGARPRWALLALTLPESDTAWLAEFAGGFFDLAQQHGVTLVGGDTTRGPLTVTVQLLGEALSGQALTRGGARPGDLVFVTGSLGDAALALAGDTSGGAGVDRTLRQRLEYPVPRCRLGQALVGLASAAIDLSDGFVADLGHLLTASGCGARVARAGLPLSNAAQQFAGKEMFWPAVLAGGDDYELCFTVPAKRAGEVDALAQRLDEPITRVGVIESDPGLRLMDEAGRPVAVPAQGYDHFPQ